MTTTGGGRIGRWAVRLAPVVAGLACAAGAAGAARWLAWLALLPLHLAWAAGGFPAGFVFAATLHTATLGPWTDALRAEVPPVASAALPWGLPVLLALPYGLLDLALRGLGRLAAGRCLAPLAGAGGLLALWLLSDRWLATKYWYALARDPAPLWIVRHAGEEGLALAVIALPLALLGLLRRGGWPGRAGLAAWLALLAWLCAGNPLAGEARRLPAVALVGLQHGPAAADALPEDVRLVAALQGVRLAGWDFGLAILPELASPQTLDAAAGGASRYRAASGTLGAAILVNGAQAAGQDGRAFVRVAALAEGGRLGSARVAKAALVPIFETGRHPRGAYWVAAGRGRRTIATPAGEVAVLLCFELFDRAALRGLAAAPALVAVIADTGDVPHPRLSQYLFDAAAFQSQVARAPVVLVNAAGPSGVAYPDGAVARVFERGQTGAFRLGPTGELGVLPLRWTAAPAGGEQPDAGVR